MKQSPKHRLPLHYLFVFGLFLSPHLLLAEGSIDFRNYAGYRLFLDNRSDQQLKVYAAAGEFLNVGASHLGIANGYITVYRPDGTPHATFTDGNGPGVINNSVEEFNGPVGAANGGYEPGVIPVTQTGIWTVEIAFPTWEVTSFTNLLNTDPWIRSVHQPQGPRAILAYDVTVSQGAAANAGGNRLEGRLFTQEFIGLINQNGFTTSPSFFVLTEQGFEWRVDFSETDPYRFPLKSSNTGFVTGDLKKTYTSQDRFAVTRSDDPTNWDPAQVYLYEPQNQDFGPIINNKIFFNPPDIEMPESALVTNIYNGNTYTDWLFRDAPFTGIPQIDITNTQLVNTELVGTPCPDSTYLPAKVTLNANLEGDIIMQFDANDNGIFNDPTDFVVQGPIEVGYNELPWDGLDGQGNPIADDLDVINYTFNLRGGEIHITLGDVENNTGGVTFKRLLQDGTIFNSSLYYDHHPVQGPVSGGGSPNNALPTQTPFTYSQNFGNNKFLDNWGYVEAQGMLSGDYTVEIQLGCTEDTDGDGADNLVDLDDDNDGVPDALEFCHLFGGGFACLPGGVDPSLDEDEDRIPNYLDANDGAVGNPCQDGDGDGICDNLPAVYDTDGDGVPDHLDLDSDNDGITDLREAEHFQPDFDQNGVIDGAPADFGANGFFNALASDPSAFDAIAVYLPLDFDEDGVPDHDDLDADNDGIHDVTEAGYLAVDNDNDGRIDPNFGTSDNGLRGNIDPALTGNGVREPQDFDLDNVPDWHDHDADNDGIHDVREADFADPDNDGFLGTGTPVVNQNGVSFTQNPTSNPTDTDDDNVPDWHDRDSDNDGINDVAEASLPDADNDGVIGSGVPTVDALGVSVLGSTSAPNDLDGDDVPDFRDLDTDNDGINDVAEASRPDADNDGIIGNGNPNVNAFGQSNSGALLPTSNPPNTDNDGPADWRDLDADNDGISDVVEAGLLDPDNDGQVGDAPTPVNADGQPTGATSNPTSTDADGIPDFRDPDSDNDGILDEDECPDDTPCTDGDGDLIPDFQDTDRDNDNIPDAVECGALTPCPDTDGDGTPDVDDADSDGDGLTDAQECPNGVPCPDSDSNGTPDWQQYTCNPASPVADLQNATGAGDYCPGTDLTLSATNADSIPGPVTYQWTGPNGFSFSGQSTDPNGPFPVGIDDLDADAAGTYELTVSSAFGCPSAPLAVNVGLAVALAEPTVFVPGGAVCTGSDQTITTQDYGAGASYEWFLDNQPLTTTNQPQLDLPNIAPTATGSYTVRVAQSGCTSNVSAPETLTVDATPLLTNAAGAGTYCTGADVTFSALGDPNAAGTVFFQWQYNGTTLDQGTADATGPFELMIDDVTAAESGLYTLQIFNGAGCASELIEQPLTVSDDIATPTISVVDNTICDAADLELSTDDYGPNANYQWFRADSLLAITSMPELDESGPVTGDYYVQIVVDNCASAVSAPISVTVGDAPQFIGLANDYSVCTDDDLTITTGVDVPLGLDEVSFFVQTPNGMSMSQVIQAGDDLTFTLPADEVIAGEYTFVLSATNGCTSGFLPVNVAVQTAPATPVLTAANDALCGNETLELSTADAGAAAEYQWIFNDGTGDQLLATTAVPLLDQTTPDAGNYSVIALLNGCASDASAPVAVQIAAAPSLSAISGTTALCAGNATQLTATLSGNGGDFTWTLPDGTEQTGTAAAGEVLTLDLTNATTAQSGTVTLTVAAPNGCPDATATTELTISGFDAAPELTAAASDICPDELLQLTATDAGAGVTYVWTYSNGNVTQQLALTALPELNLPNAQSGIYTVEASLNGCLSPVSGGVAIEVLPAPTATALTGETDLCAGDALTLSTTLGNVDATFVWTLPDGSEVTGTGTAGETLNLTISDATIALGGTITFALTSADACAGDPQSIDVTVNETPDQPTLAVADEFLCAGDALNLTTDDQGAGVIYRWFADTGNGPELIATTPVPTLNLTDLAPGQTGAYSVVAESGGCASTASAAQPVTVANPPTVIAEVSAEGPLCAGEAVQLTVELPNNSTVVWSGPDGFSSTESDPILDNLTAANAGDYVATVTTPTCTVTTEAITLEFLPEILATDDLVTGPLTDEVTADVSANDAISEVGSITIVTPPATGAAEVRADGSIVFRPGTDFDGTDELTYEICEADCPEQCARAVLRFDLDVPDEELTCDAPNVITPNGDGANDFFRIPCLDDVDEYPRASVRIFNRRGDVVHEAEPYRNDWDARYNGRELPAGTYFYLLRLRPTDAECASGYITVTR